MSEVTLAAVQMNSTDVWPENARQARLLLERCRDQGAALAVLPENFSLMPRAEAQRRALAEAEGNGPVQDFLAESAARLGLWIVAGTTPLRIPGSERFAQACLVFDRSGKRVARYDKMHLFDVDLPESGESYRESAHLAPGGAAVVVDTPAGRLGLSICYDMRFPELYRRMVAEGAEWFTVPAAFTVPTGQAHWHVLLRARAIENLCAVVASAQCGVHPSGRGTYGHSLIVDHWGAVRAQLPAGEGVIVAAIDRAAQAEARRKFPALAHRRL